MFRKRAKKNAQIEISIEDLLKLVPLRNPTYKWERENSGKVTVLVPLSQHKDAPRLAKMFKPRGPKKIILDRLSADIWELCDGVNTVNEVVAKFCVQMKVRRRQVQPAILTLLNDLTKKGLIGLSSKEALSGRLGTSSE